MEYRRQSNARLNHQSRSAGSSTNHCRDGLEDGSVSAPVSTGPKMARGVEGSQSGPEEESRGGDRPATDGRSMAAADRQGHSPGALIYYGRERGNFKKVQRAQKT